jgi:hypothetical protein
MLEYSGIVNKECIRASSDESYLLNFPTNVSTYNSSNCDTDTLLETVPLNVTFGECAVNVRDDDYARNSLPYVETALVTNYTFGMFCYINFILHTI